ncbi:MAG: type II toxin-antitoxin system VapC family toxin [Acidobacteria bacterium]|nr:type II toxin-antitoxin system VapC family toxin [Acidobacteriota bacterium]
MTLSDARLGRRVYLDTNLYIYLFEGLDEYRRSMADLTAEIDRLDIAVIASELIFTELLPRPVRDGRAELVEAYLELMQRTPRVTLVPVDRRVILRAVHLRADFGLRSMDALHVATALVHGCETFLTNDERLRVGSQIHVLTLRTFAASRAGEA